MTQALPVTGLDINLAARATRAVLVELLHQAGTTFPDWAVLNSIGASGGTLEYEALRDRLAAGLGADEPAIAGLLEQLRAAGLIRERSGAAGSGAVSLELTADGDALYQRLQAAVGQLTAQLYSGLDADDLAITRRVLLEVTQRANARLAGARSQPGPVAGPG